MRNRHKFAEYDDLVEWFVGRGRARDLDTSPQARPREEVVTTTIDEMDAFLALVESRAHARATLRLRN